MYLVVPGMYFYTQFYLLLIFSLTLTFTMFWSWPTDDLFHVIQQQTKSLLNLAKPHKAEIFLSNVASQSNRQVK